MYQRALGDRFGSLDPQLRVYFGPIPAGHVGIGEGVFHEAGLRLRALRPLFALLGRWHVAFPEHGTDVPFTVRNEPTADGALASRRVFRFGSATREMRDWIRVVGDRLVDRVGTGGRIDVELELLVSEGSITLTSRRIALRIGGIRVPLPPVVRLVVRERALDSEPHTQQVGVRMTAPLLGEIYGYSGSFTYALQRATVTDPQD